jgi:cation diffusion facilitator family transporter
VPTEHRLPEIHAPLPERRHVVRAGVVSLVAGAGILAAKFAAWLITGSSAILADAAESIVNVVAAAVVTLGVVVASRPADADHPYGHGKAEFVSAALEAAMIVIAATLILVESAYAMWRGPELRDLGTGILVAGGAGAANLALGLYLLGVGRRERSAALAADGMHVLSDVLTTVGALGALALVRVSGFVLLDPLVGMAVGAHILRTGWKIMRRALAGLLDEADFPLLGTIAAELESARRAEWVEIHQLRAWSSGAVKHVDLHLAVPRYFAVEDAHDLADDLQTRILKGIGGVGDVVVHLDPCVPRHCAACTMPRCPVRSRQLEKPFAFTVESLTQAGAI